MKKKCTAILLAAGAGKRMESNMAKQYMLLNGKPVIWYGLQAFEESAFIEECILVVGKGEIPYARENIVDAYQFTKVKHIIEGGAERYLSVWNALKTVKEALSQDDIILIQDGARPFATEKLIRDTINTAKEYGACCAAVPVKDTIRIAGEDGFFKETPDRRCIYSIQTPQAFKASVILQAYELLMEKQGDLNAGKINITDDCMVVEQMLKHPIKPVEASYTNIKITTPEDMAVAEQILKRK